MSTCSGNSLPIYQWRIHQIELFAKFHQPFVHIRIDMWQPEQHQARPLRASVCSSQTFPHVVQVREEIWILTLFATDLALINSAPVGHIAHTSATRTRVGFAPWFMQIAG